MKTQIILRTVLIVVALFVFTNNNGNNINSATHSFIMHSAINTSSQSHLKGDGKTTQHDNTNPGKEDPLP